MPMPPNTTGLLRLTMEPMMLPMAHPRQALPHMNCTRCESRRHSGSAQLSLMGRHAGSSHNVSHLYILYSLDTKEAEMSDKTSMGQTRLSTADIARLKREI